MLRDITEFDLFFLSYDEPNADWHWADLLDKAPWAQRVHGVTGFDAAHRACAERSETDWFVTVDADNIVSPGFFNLQVEIGDNPRECLSWNAVNAMNGLMYGNGGLKLWSREFVLTMNTHENADDPRKAVDFCWENDYRQVPVVCSEVHVTGSPYQAYRAGFREGVKLSLDRGERIRPEEMRSRLHAVNLRNLRIWCSVGAHVENGKWAMLGARTGWRLMCDMGWDHTVVRSYDWFKEHWASLAADGIGGDFTEMRIYNSARFADEIETLTKIPVPYLNASQSQFFRDMFIYRND